MFTLNTEDLQYIFDSAGKSIIVNDTKMNVIVTNPTISEYEERYIHSLQKVSRGDILTMDNEKYICITETVTKRHSKFKTLIRHCNVTVEKEIFVDEFIGESDFGEPIYELVYDHSEFIPATVDNKSFSVNNSSAWRYPENQIEVIVRDIEENRTLFSVGEKFETVGKSWRVLNQDLSKSGLMILTCEKI
ncbi:hypothetical protein [Peribacillus asahii]|uniref:hypothetical protein n=1 Tax=Peribacillus asahii TaxID=228899 RepID=UPI0037F90FCA